MTSAKRAAAQSAPEVEIIPAKYFARDVIAGKYTLISILGEGGMGSVWLARNTTLDVDVAVKLIRREMSTPEASARLLQEARAAARLGHPSIVRVFDFGETEYRDPYIVMEVLRGESLGAVLDRRGRLPAVNAVQMLLPVASALSTAHRKGIVHRDLKPDNIVLVTDETGAIIPKIVDFGIAKLKRDDVDRMATQIGTVLGSPDYMSPEQARGRGDIDERADVWALSVVLYEAITGRRPFDGVNYNALLTAIIEDSPTPCTEFAAGDAELWVILKRGLAKTPAERWPSMRAMGSALGGWAMERGFENDIAGTSIAQHWLEAGARQPISNQPPPSDSARLLISRDRIKDPNAARAVDVDVEGSVPPVAANEQAITDAVVRRIEAETLPPPLPVVPVDLPRDSASELAAPPPVTSVPLVWSPPRKKGGRAVTAIVVGLALVGGAAFLGRERLLGAFGTAPAGTSIGPVTPPRAPDVQPMISSAPSVAATAAPAAITPGAEEPTNDVGQARAREIDACAVRLFAGGTFDPAQPPSFASMCSESDPRRGATTMRSDVVRASTGKKVSEGMREWSMLSWYELAAFSAVRSTCCASPVPLVLPPPVGACAPLDQTLNNLGAAVATGADFDGPLTAYTKAVHCTVSSGAAAPYKFETRPQGGEEEALRKTLARAKGAKKVASAPPKEARPSAPRPATKKSPGGAMPVPVNPNF